MAEASLHRGKQTEGAEEELRRNLKVLSIQKTQAENAALNQECESLRLNLLEITDLKQLNDKLRVDSKVKTT